MRLTPILTLAGWTLLGLALLSVTGPLSHILAAMLLSGFSGTGALIDALRTGLREVLLLIPSVISLMIWRRTHPAMVRVGPDGGLLLGLAAGVGLALGAIATAAAAGTLGPGDGPDARDISTVGALLLLAPIGLMHGSVEEIVFRGIIQEAAMRVVGVRGCVVVGALAWALLQAIQGFNSPMQLLNSCLVGLGFGLIALRAGVLAAGAAHGAWTWLETQVFGLSANAIPALFDLHVVTRGLWAGQGPDTSGGLSTTIAACGLIFVFALILGRPAKPNSARAPQKAARAKPRHQKAKAGNVGT